MQIKRLSFNLYDYLKLLERSRKSCVLKTYYIIILIYSSISMYELKKKTYIFSYIITINSNGCLFPLTLERLEN